MRTAKDAARARWAITAVFASNGLVVASLVVRTPSLKLDLDLATGQLGLVAGLFGVAALLAMQAAGRFAARLGSAPVVRVSIALAPVALIGIGLAPGFAALIAFQLLFGATQGMLDVTMNAHAITVERSLRRHILNSCHGAWSIGTVAGSLLGTGAAHTGMARWLHYVVLAGVLLPVVLVVGRHLLPPHVDRVATAAAGRESGRRTNRQAGWPGRLLVFGAMGAIVLTAEAAVANWSGVFLQDDLGASLGVASLGYLAFSACQTAGRLVGDRLLARVSATRLLRINALTAAAGLALAVASPWSALGIAGFALLGVGLAAPLPVLFGVVGHLDKDSTVMVARFGTMTFTGLLVSPSVIGWVAEVVGLAWTLAALVPLLLAVASAAGITAAASRPTSRDQRARQVAPAV